MTVQLPLALDFRHVPDLDDFVAGPNQQVLDAIARLINGHGESPLYLFGGNGSGRSHLLTAGCGAGELQGLRCAYIPLAQHEELAPEMLEGLADLDLLAIDDVQAIAGNRNWEQSLFVLFNQCRESGSRLLFSADCGPAALPIRLPDLRSRLSWGLSYALLPLDDTHRQRLLKVLAARRALELPEDVARYLIERGPRHPSDLVHLVEHLDRASLVEHRRLTIPFVRESLNIG